MPLHKRVRHHVFVGGFYPLDGCGFEEKAVLTSLPPCLYQAASNSSTASTVVWCSL